MRELESYHFYEDDWSSLEALRDSFEWEVPETFNVARYVCDRWAEARKNRVALYVDVRDGPDRSYTFRQLRNDSNRLANYFRSRGIEQGDRIAVGGAQRVETLLSHLAAWKLGATSVPVSSLLGSEGLRYRVADCNAVAHVVDGDGIDTHREVVDQVDSLATRVVMGAVDPGAGEVAFWDALEGHSRQFDTVRTGPEDDFEIIYTSGTTGDPKGVRHAHEYVLGLLPSVVTGHRNMDVRDEDVVRATAEWSWAGTLNIVLLGNLFYGNPAVAAPGGEFDPEREFDLIETFGVTLLSTAPTAYRMMMPVAEPAKRWDLESIRVLVAGGEAVGSSLVSWINETFDDPAIHPGYGQTECTFPIGHCEALGVGIVPGDNVCGLAYPGHEAAIVDPADPEKRVSEGVGELMLYYEGNPACFKSYLDEPEKTAAKLHGEWMLTEDLVYRDENGYIVYQSRADDVIITSGHRVGPEEIEEALARHDAVFDAGVIGIPDDRRGQIAKAYIVVNDGFEPSDSLVETLQSFVKDLLAKYEYPREIEFVEELPRTTTGKIRRTDLRAREGIE
jgi:acetyl-CoA synthetase